MHTSLILSFCFLCFFLLSLTESVHKIQGVILTTGKDTRAFEKSIVSALKYLVDVENFYIIAPSAKQIEERLSPQLGPRVKFVDESIFPFDWKNISHIMIETVRERGVYPLNDKSPFESTVWGRTGWFLQQLLKFYAGKILDLGDFVLLDSDIIWFKTTKFINETITINGNEAHRYYYASSSQYHPPYMATLKRISGFDLYKSPDTHRSGIAHHMVISKLVLEDLMETSEKLHGGIPFWQVLLNESAIEMTCRAPRAGICGAGSTLSEYELYFNYARQKFPETVQLRPLMWANGPAPGLQFWPPVESDEIQSDGPKSHWIGHRQNEIPRVMVLQAEADRAQGYDFVAYHGYGKRRYFELVGPDIEEMCNGVPPPRNTTCSWRGYEDNAALRKERPVEDWFGGCACYMANHQSGP